MIKAQKLITATIVNKSMEYNVTSVEEFDLNFTDYSLFECINLVKKV